VSLRFGLEIRPACSSAYTQYVFSGNNPVDPGGSLSTTQPVGYDYWAIMYERYRVIGSRIRIVAQVGGLNAAGSAPGLSGQIAVYPSNASAAVSSLSDAMSQPYVKFKEFNTAQRCEISTVMPTAKISGIKVMEGADQLQATIGTGPANEWFWCVGWTNTTTYNTAANDFLVEVTYDVEFFDRAQLNKSTLDFVHRAYLHHCQLLIKREIESKEKQKTPSDFLKRIEIELGDSKLESKVEHLKPLCVSEDEEDYPLEVLKSKAKEAQRKLALAENDLKLETASRKGK
jgi:hypothetical protein